MEIEIRDKRNKGWFWLDNEYLNGYARYLGATTTVVYISLCRHANNDTQESYPSMRLIAEENGISAKTVERAVKKLEQWKIISVIRRKKEDGTQQNNLYTLTDKKVWKSKPTDTMTVGADRQTGALPTDNNDNSRQTPVPHNKTTIINKTNIISKTSFAENETNRVVDCFKIINPNYEQLFKNTTQRGAVLRLIKKYGVDGVCKLIRASEWANTQKYAPVITTPIQLEAKAGELRIFIQRQKLNKVSVLEV